MAQAATTKTDFDSIREQVRRGTKLFEDSSFPAALSSVYGKSPFHGKIKWMRPHEIAEEPPGFIVKGIDRFDVKQGKLGNCWMVAALACLPDHVSLFHRVVPPGQSFDPGWYTGIFRFNFWRFGKWEEVIVDDRLPTRNEGNLMFISSSQDNEFWAALVEKAYAKWNGYYMALEGGLMGDSFTDLTGGVNETYSLQKPDAIARDSLIRIVSKALKRKSVIGCSIFSGGSDALYKAKGLAAGHAYSLTGLETVKLMNGSQVVLARIRNPWGEGAEWKGGWGDESQLWSDILPEEKDRLLSPRLDGEFWMMDEDFMEEFHQVDICNVTPDCPEGSACRWHSFQFQGRWTKSTTAGGRPGKENHWHNPQFLLNLTDTDNDDPSRCSFLVQLLQSNQNKDGSRKKTKALEEIGFAIYPKVASGQPRKTADSGQHSRRRQVVKRFSLPPGQYCVLPSTYHAGTEADFYIRFFFEEGNDAKCLQGGRPVNID